MEADSKSIMARSMLRTLRTRLLIGLDRVYPSTLDDVTICSMESDPPGLQTIRREMHYLSEKGLISIQTTGGGSLIGAITAKGRDLVMGEFEEIGIESAGAYGYTGQ